MNKIQILMATYNGEKYIAEQIESIINQDYEDWELLVRDDCSTDNTPNIINEYLSNYPDKILLIKNNSVRLGASQNFMYLLSKSTSDYVMFCDQDDVWNKNKLSLFFNSMIVYEGKYNNNTPIIIHSDLEIIDSQNKTIAKSFHELAKTPPEKFTTLNKLLVKCFPGCSTMINRSLINISLLHSLKDIESHDLWMFLIASIFGKVFYLEEKTMKYRLHSNNTIGLGSKRGGYEKNILKILINFNKKRNIFYQDEQVRHKCASLILDNYVSSLSKETTNILLGFNYLTNSSFLLRKYYLFKYNFFEENFLMNLRRFVYY